MVLKDVRNKVEKTWTTTKKILAAMSAWGLVFALVTIGRLGVAFDYDDSLVDSSKAYEKAARMVQQVRSPQYWSIVNNAYDLESPKLIPLALACAFRVLGFKILIIADRQASDGEALKKEWRKLAPRSFIFDAAEPANKHLYLQDGHYVLFFGDSDRDMLEARKAGVYAVRIKRGRNAVADDDYNPGRLGEFAIPLSEF